MHRWHETKVWSDEQLAEANQMLLASYDASNRSLEQFSPEGDKASEENLESMAKMSKEYKAYVAYVQIYNAINSEQQATKENLYPFPVVLFTSPVREPCFWL